MSYSFETSIIFFIQFYYISRDGVEDGWTGRAEQVELEGIQMQCLAPVVFGRLCYFGRLHFFFPLRTNSGIELEFQLDVIFGLIPLQIFQTWIIIYCSLQLWGE